MALVDVSSLVGKEIITQDGYILGVTQDLRYEPGSWSIRGFKVKTGKTVSEVINIGSGKSMVMLEAGDYVINDVILLPFAIDSARSKISADNESCPPVSFLLGKKVFSSGGLFVGTVEKAIIDTISWSLLTFEIKLDKNACEPLGVKKGLFAKKVSGIEAVNIQVVTDSIVLNIDDETIKSQIVVI